MNASGDRVTAEDFRRVAGDVLHRAGAHKQVAADVTEALLTASLRGIDTHGIGLLPQILKRVEAGRCQLSKPIRAAAVDEKACVVFDANLAPGQHAGLVVARAAIDRACRFGLGMACVRNSTHFGAVTPYVVTIVEKGLIGLVGSNSTPSMAAFGATFPNLGNNPLGFGAPVEGGPALIFDYSCGVMSFGRLAKILADSGPVPEDAFVKPSDVPQSGAVYEVAGGLEWAARPFGDYKGASIAVMIEVLSGLLSGGFFGMKTESVDGDQFRGPSHFALAIDPHLFGVGDLAESMSIYTDGIRQGHDSVRLPGARAATLAEERQRRGIPIPLALKDVLESSATAV